jgi:hypothetical protein
MKNHQMPFHSILFCASILCLSATGCGPGRGELSGKVSYKDKPVVSGSVVVAGSDGVPKGGEIKPDGTYEVKDIAAGQVKITVHSPDPGAMKIIPRKKDQPPPPPKDRSKWFAIPEAYADFEKSELTFMLKRGKNSFDINLTK